MEVPPTFFLSKISRLGLAGFAEIGNLKIGPAMSWTNV